MVINKLILGTEEESECQQWIERVISNFADACADIAALIREKNGDKMKYPSLKSASDYKPKDVEKMLDIYLHNPLGFKNEPIRKTAMFLQNFILHAGSAEWLKDNPNDRNNYDKVTSFIIAVSIKDVAKGVKPEYINLDHVNGKQIVRKKEQKVSKPALPPSNREEKAIDRRKRADDLINQYWNTYKDDPQFETHRRVALSDAREMVLGGKYAWKGMEQHDFDKQIQVAEKFNFAAAVVNSLSIASPDSYIPSPEDIMLESRR